MRHNQPAGLPGSLSEIGDALRPFLISRSPVCPGPDPQGIQAGLIPLDTTVLRGASQCEHVVGPQ